MAGIQRTAEAEWKGNLRQGSGTITSPSGVLTSIPYSFGTRFENTPGTNPEELVGAAHAGCFSMFLSALISADNMNPTSVQTTATVHLGTDDGPKITSIDLVCEATVPGLDAGKFAEYAQTAKEKCPISRLFAGTEINLSAKLLD